MFGRPLGTPAALASTPAAEELFQHDRVYGADHFEEPRGGCAFALFCFSPAAVTYFVARRTPGKRHSGVHQKMGGILWVPNLFLVCDIFSGKLVLQSD